MYWYILQCSCCYVLMHFTCSCYVLIHFTGSSYAIQTTNMVPMYLTCRSNVWWMFCNNKYEISIDYCMLQSSYSNTFTFTVHCKHLSAATFEQMKPYTVTSSLTLNKLDWFNRLDWRDTQHKCSSNTDTHRITQVPGYGQYGTVKSALFNIHVKFLHTRLDRVCQALTLSVLLSWFLYMNN